MEVRFLDVDAKHDTRRFAELDHRCEQIGIRRQPALAADAQGLVDARHEEDQLHEARTFDNVLETVDPVVAGTVRHQQPVGSFDMDEAGIAAARRSIDAAVGA